MSLDRFVTIVRVYNNGDRVTTIHPQNEVADEVGFNFKHRLGVALFVDGICIKRGRLSPERCEEIGHKLRKEYSDDN